MKPHVFVSLTKPFYSETKHLRFLFPYEGEKTSRRMAKRKQKTRHTCPVLRPKKYEGPKRGVHLYHISHLKLPTGKENDDGVVSCACRKDDVEGVALLGEGRREGVMKGITNSHLVLL